MSKEQFNQDQELAQRENELGNRLKQLETAPLRAGFQEELRGSLQMAIQKGIEGKSEAVQGNCRKEPFWRSWFQNGPVGKMVACFLALLLCGSVLFWSLGKLNPPSQTVLAGVIEITAMEEDKLGVETESGFLLTSEKPLAEKIVKENLRIEPAVDYTLDKGDGGKEYRIIPRAKLAANTVYRIAFDPEGKGRAQFSWAFQTKGEFRIVRTLPGDQTTHVPVNTGIELVLSHDNFSVDKVQKYVSISPQVEGSFEKHQRTLVFVPKRPLKAGCFYTVTVKKGLPLLKSETALSADYTFSFETAPATEEEVAFTFDVNKDVEEFSTTDAPTFGAYLFAKQKVPAATVTVYRYHDTQAFVSALRERDKIPEWTSILWQNYRQDFSGLSKVAEYQQEFLSIDSYSHYLMFPEVLPAGYYAAEIKVKDCMRQVWFQVTDLAVYLAQGQEKNLFWVNNLQTKKPVQDAEVQLVGSNRRIKGDKQGVITLEQNMRTEKKEYALVKSSAGEIVVPFFSARYNELAAQKLQNDPRDYWKYFYLDRELFKPDDTIHFWGVMGPRQGAEKLTEVEIVLQGTGRSYSWREKAAPLLRKQVSVEQNTFQGELKLPTLTPGYYYLEVRKGDTLFLSRGFTVDIYQKPAYQIKVEPEKKAIFTGEKMGFLAKATFFEGTPVPQVKINFNIWDQNGQVTTDGKGFARIPYTGKTHEEYYSPYHYVYLGVTATMPEAGDIGMDSHIWVFPSKLLIEGTAKRNGTEFILNAGLSEIDLTKLNAGKDLTRENYVSGPAEGKTITGVLYQEVWTKEESGQRYNFISKEVETLYTYNYSTKKLSEFTLVTDQEGKAVYQGSLDPQESYYLELTAQDADGRVAKERVYLYQGNGSSRNDFYKYYELQLAEGQEEFAGGDQVSLTFLGNGAELPGKAQGYLFYRGQKEIETYQLLDKGQYSFAYAPEDLPNTNVGAVYFDGANYHEVLPRVIPFNREKKALQVQITTDKAEYRPKDKVKLHVKVTDDRNKPVKASVNLNLVDEAIYSMQEQQVNFLANLYQDFIRLYLDSKATHEHPQYGGGAEKGGEGGAERKDFMDTVLFTTVETNSRGQAQAEFVLPDNLTSWRVTYHALTETMQAQSGTGQVVVRLPFFVDMVFNDQYLSGDAPVVVVRSFGEKVTAQDAVSYKLELQDPAGKVLTQQKQGTVGQSVDWQLPSLQEGTYTLVVDGKSGKYSDKLRQEFTVVSSLLERTRTDHQLLQEKMKLEGSTKEPTLIVFTDYEKSQYLRGLSSLAYQGGSRLEQKLAAREAQKLLTQYYAESAGLDNHTDQGETEKLQTYQQADGGIAILPYAESEPALTALVASLGSPDFDYGAMTGYFYDLLETGKERGEDLTVALWGLGAIGEPVLLDIEAFLTEKELAPAQKVHLALAMLDIGNGATARQIYEELLEDYSENLGNTFRIRIGTNQDEIIAATSQIAMLAAKLDAPEKNKLYQYLLENQGQELLNNLEQLQVLQYQLRYLESEPVSFTYERNGKAEKVTLKGHETFALRVLPDELPQIKFSDINGKVGVMTVYSKPYSKLEIPVRNDLEVKRSYAVAGETGTTVQRGELVEVVLNYEVKDLAPGGRYEIVDILPAGLQYVPQPYQRVEKVARDFCYPSEVKGQKVSFHVGKAKDKIVYYARVISPGEFRAQGTLLSQVNNQDVCILGNEDRINIK